MMSGRDRGAIVVSTVSATPESSHVTFANNSLSNRPSQGRVSEREEEAHWVISER